MSSHEINILGYKMIDQYSHFIKKLEKENKSNTISSCVYNTIRETVYYLQNKYSKESIRSFYFIPSNKIKMDYIFNSYKDNMTIFQSKKIDIIDRCHHCCHLSHSHIFQICDDLN